MFIVHEGKRLRCGITTGSCAAAATKAALLALLEKSVETVDIKTPEDLILNIKVDETKVEDNFGTACVTKDAGDDIDATDKIKIFAKVRFREDDIINIDGGVGVGRFIIDSPYGKKGQAAINKVPREMIKRAVREVTQRGVDVIIFAPEGVEVAKNTYNPRLGIEGGISIIGTKGIVYPMSDDAMKKTIYMELEMIVKRTDKVIFTFGNHGENYIEKIGLKGEVVKTSNYVGDALLYAKELGFREIKIVGHIGKMCKISIGAFNTHSKIVDSRMESFVYYLAKLGAGIDVINKIESFKTAEEAANYIMDSEYAKVLDNMKKGIEDRIKAYLKDETFSIEAIIYTFRMLG
ncbi:cobalt-precorrin-6A synthase [Caloramator mitchellensis]|uniref:Cobalt-precorrin-5B C(1)-methyltransferase n=1 Tax=Caloramator mitchellensis TaxID=908809 RepID=A0A0R3JXJ3_CALMK|nr:cobalt-precorrin-5B (C(1))-methyltransferase CbiD [Caloramator mitchellensis]KRQ85918.1 cobalt-precorrin-6A synthase [Caloramator mitchellensis]